MLNRTTLLQVFSSNSTKIRGLLEYVYASGVCRKFSWGCFIQWRMVVICIWCALFVTSQFDVIFMFPNQRFGEVC